MNKEPSNTDLQEQIKTLEDSVLALTQSVQTLAEAWNNAKGITSFIKWAAGFAASLSVVWAALHGSKP